MKQTRRQMLRMTGQALAGAVFAPSFAIGAQKEAGRAQHGAIIGEMAGAEAGTQILAEGGNAVDAIVCAALVSCVAVPSRCGVAGYGGHLTIALAGGEKIVSLDFNSAAPQAARPDMYPTEATGKVRDDLNGHGWLAAGVPGTLAGLQMALDRFGSRSLRELAQPAVQLAKKGVVVSPVFASTIRSAAPRLRKDPASAKIYLPDGQPLEAGALLQNPELAELVSTLAERNSVETFYRGDIAQRLAEAFKKNGGLVTADDLAAYHAREVRPLRLDWKEFSIYTAPLTAGGLTVLEALGLLKALDWKPNMGASSIHARVEALRIAWKDRLELLGDPEKVSVPVEKLLSKDYARQQSKEIRAAIKAQHPIPIQIEKHLDEGTVNLSSVDARGNMAALTLTHGAAFGAQVTAEGLGAMLGHGMSRFVPYPNHPNCPAPGKRPLHNMCPTVVTRRGKPVLAVGGAGGVKIPNALYEVLTQFVLCGRTLEEAVAAPRMHCTGTTDVSLESTFPQNSADSLRQIGFKVTTAPAALVSAVHYNPASGECRAAIR